VDKALPCGRPTTPSTAPGRLRAVTRDRDTRPRRRASSPRPCRQRGRSAHPDTSRCKSIARYAAPVSECMKGWGLSTRWCCLRGCHAPGVPRACADRNRVQRRSDVGAVLRSLPRRKDKDSPRIDRYLPTGHRGVPMEQLVLLDVAALVGLVGYNAAVNFETRYSKRAWRTPALVWGLSCLLLGPIAVLFLLVAEHKTRRRAPASTSSVAPPQQPSVPQQRLSPAPQQRSTAPPSQRPSVPRPKQPLAPRPQQHFTPRPQQHPSDPHKMYLFGAPQPQQPWAPSFGWSSSSLPAPLTGNVGGTDLLPHRSRHPSPNTRNARERDLRRGCR
jgi:hypothetical protein